MAGVFISKAGFEAHLRVPLANEEVELIIQVSKNSGTQRQEKERLTKDSQAIT